MSKHEENVDMKATIKKLQDERNSEKMDIELLLKVRQKAYEIAQRPHFERPLEGQVIKDKYIILGIICDDLLQLHNRDLKEGTETWCEAMGKEFYVNIVPQGFRVEVPEKTRYSCQ